MEVERRVVQSGRSLVFQPVLIIWLVVAFVGFLGCSDCERVPVEWCEDSDGAIVAMSVDGGAWTVVGDYYSGANFSPVYHPTYVGAVVSAQLDLGDTKSRCFELGWNEDDCQKMVMYIGWLHSPNDGDSVVIGVDENAVGAEKVYGVVELFAVKALGAASDYSRDDHYLLSSGKITVEDVFPTEHKITYSLVFVPNPHFDEILRELKLNAPEVRFEGAVGCVPRTEYHCRYF